MTYQTKTNIMNTEITFVRENEINDIFSYIDKNGELEYISFPRSMGMTITEVQDYLN